MAMAVNTFSGSLQQQGSEQCWALRGPEEIHKFWFGCDFDEDHNTVAYLQRHMPKWFMGCDAHFDIAQLRARSAVEKAAKGELKGEAWEAPRGLLAQILLCDQFSRSIFRGSPEAYAQDHRSVELCLETVKKGLYGEAFRPIERFFICVALSHSEDRASNALHAELAAKISDSSTPPEVARWFADLEGFPHEHTDCIRRFGRFPHRNEQLGRASRPEELEWLASPKCPNWARSQRTATLTYWQGRGLGEPIRMLLTFACVPFKNNFVKTREEFLALAPTLPFGQVPLYDDGQCQVVQTQAILRYVAAKRGLLGATPNVAADADMIVNAVLDARDPLIKWRFRSDAKEALEAFATTTLPKICGHLECWLAKNGNNYFAGSEATYADVVTIEFLEYVRDELPSKVETTSDLAMNHPKLFSFWSRMREFDHLAAYIDSPERVPKPSDDFVRNTCEILAIPLPSYLQC